MTSNTAAEATSPGAGRSRLIWFPIAWPLVLAVGCAWLWSSDVDPGVTNTSINIAVSLAVFGNAVWLVRRSGLSRWLRWTLAVVPCLLLTAFYLQLLPFEVVLNGDVGIVGVRWRWAAPDRTIAPPEAATAATPLDWRETPQDYPRFLGHGFWAEVRGVELQTDWQTHQPRELWRRKVGAGWSGFAIVGEYAVTQEQRGEAELVVCYDMRTGEPVWTHADRVRWDPRGGGALGGVGPRATPTIHQSRVITQGATGIVNCLDASTGKLLWSHDTLREHDAGNVMWGKAGSPLIVDDRVVISVGGVDGASLVAYELRDGRQAWAAGDDRSSYASPIVAELAGVRQIVSLDEAFVVGRRIGDGEELWRHPWPSDSDSNAASSQPVPIGDDRVLLSMGYGAGAEVFQLRRDEDRWVTETLWKKPAVLKTKMGNVVIRDGFAYGLNDIYMQCVDLKTGRAAWTKRRNPTFGHGQIMLVGDVVLVLGESGELILFEASPKKYRELASFPALTGVTWNNPALAGNRLLVRNAEEAACYELPTNTPATPTQSEPDGS